MRIELQSFRTRAARRLFLVFVACAIVPVLVAGALAYRELAHQLHDGSRARMGDFSANYGLAVIDRLREANGLLVTSGTAGESPAQSIARLRANGVHVDEVTIAHAADMQAIYLLIVLAEAADYHGPILERSAASYTAPVRMRLEMGRYVLAEDYLRAQRGRAVIRREIDAALDGRDALLLPTVPIPAPIQGATTVRVGQRDEPVRSAMLRLTQPFSLSTHPALTIPAAPTPAGLPVGLQLVGHLGRTPRLLGCGRACEIALGSRD